jgi:Ca-activated chloride channel family protein
VQQLGGPVIYSIGLLYEADSQEEAKKAHDVLETLSAETGGIAYFPQSLEEVQGIAQMVARDIRNQYIVGYHSPDLSKGGYRSVRVEAQANGYGKLIVRTRKGYYPEKQTPAVKPGQKIAAAPRPPN